MENKFDELINMLGNNKNGIKYLIAIYIIVTIVVIAFIWWPKEKNYSTYESLDITTKKAELAQNYINEITDLFKNSKVEEVSSLISDSYIAYTGKIGDDIIEELKLLGLFSNNILVSGMNVYEDEYTYIYSSTIYSGNNSKTINLIEKEPYKYSIAFDNFYDYDIKEDKYIIDNIKFTINSIYRSLNHVELNFSIHNLSTNSIKFSFSNVNGVQAILEDTTQYLLANSVSSEEYTNVEPNKVINKKMVFNIPVQSQEKIEQIVFNNVTIGASNKNIVIEL